MRNSTYGKNQTRHFADYAQLFKTPCIVLDGKARRLGFKKVVAISSSGFTKTAVLEARERGIETLHLREALARDWEEWQFGLDTFGIHVQVEPVATRTEIAVPPKFRQLLPEVIDMEEAYIVDLNKKVKVKVKDWVAGFMQDPEIRARFAEQDKNDAINHYTCTIPCDSHIGFAHSPDAQIVPMTELRIYVDSVKAEYSVPLAHYRANDHKVHVGESLILGNDTRVVLHEKPGQLVVMLEQKVPPRKSKTKSDQA